VDVAEALVWHAVRKVRRRYRRQEKQRDLLFRGVQHESVQ